MFSATLSLDHPPLRHLRLDQGLTNSLCCFYCMSAILQAPPRKPPAATAGGMFSGPARMMRRALEASAGCVPSAKDASPVRERDGIETVFVVRAVHTSGPCWSPRFDFGGATARSAKPIFLPATFFFFHQVLELLFSLCCSVSERRLTIRGGFCFLEEAGPRSRREGRCSVCARARVRLFSCARSSTPGSHNRETSSATAE